jgi:hypothetical protein
VNEDKMAGGLYCEGSGGKGQVQVALQKKGLAPTIADFFVI